MTTPVRKPEHHHHAWVSSVASNVTARALGLSSTVLMARALGPVNRGIVAAITVWPLAFASLGAFVGVSTSAYFLARKGPGWLKACLLIALTSGAVMLLVSV